ncbi:hypothetical protein D3C87_1304800 [compost metagenome]
MNGEVEQVTGNAPGHMPGCRQRACKVEKRTKVRARHDRHAHERSFAHGFAQTLEQLADFSSVIRRSDHRASAGAGSWSVAMDVGNRIAVSELQRGVLFEERDHSRAGLEERIYHRWLVTLAQFMFQVGARLLDVFDDTRATGQGIARHPRPSTGPRRGAAKHRVFLDHNDVQAMPCSSDCRRQSGCTGANDQHVAVNIRSVVWFGRHV